MAMEQSDRPKHDYSTLPEDILTDIAKRLHSVDDTLRFRAVCDMFRSLVSTPLTNLIPKSARRSSFRMGPLNTRRTQQQIRRIRKPANHFLLTESTVYAVEPRHPISNPLGTSQTWMIRIEHTNSGEVRLKDPLCGYRFESLYNKLPKCFNLLDYQIKEITKAYQLEPARKSKGRSRLFYKEMFKKKPPFFVKVVVSRAAAPDDKFSVMAIHCSGKLFVWKIGDKSLTDIFLGHDSYEDIIYHNRKFYALDYMGNTLSVDSRSFEVIRVTYMDGGIPAGRHHLVKSCEDLFLVFRRWAYEASRIYFEAFKLDEERSQWVPVVDELEDMTLFIGEDCSFAVSAKEFRGCKGNCIYFNLHRFSKGVNEDYPGACAGIFNFKDNAVGRLAVFPGNSEIFWPLPSWLNFHAASTSTAHAPH